MPSRSYTSRRELEQYHFSAIITLLVPIVLLLLQALLPRLSPILSLLDLPLLAVVYFSVARRNPLAGTVTGTIIGLFADALSGQPLGIRGIADALVGYAASSIGVKVDVDSLATRVLMIFGFTLLESALLFLIHRTMLGESQLHLAWVTELLRAVLNAVIAIPLFLALDHFRLRD